jgi:hypothetical protein
MGHTYLNSHGVLLDVEVQDESLAEEVLRILPPGWLPTDEFPEDGHFTLSAQGDGTYDVYAEEMPVASGVAADVALHVLDAQIRARIALLAEGRIFVHAGVVAVDGRAIVLPAPSFSGKSALVAALVAEGATYYSDEFAVLDPAGKVHPYAKPLSLRPNDGRYGERQPVEALGGQAGDVPAEVALVVVTKYVPGSVWAPQRREPGFGALALLTNAIPARSRVEEAMRATTGAARSAAVLQGDRGEAAHAAASLIRELAL